MLRRLTFLPVFVAAVLMVAGAALAQDQGGGGGRRRDGGGGGGGGFDPAQARQRMMDRLKEQLGAKDDEWQVLAPKLEKVMNAQRDARGGWGGFGRGGRGGDGGGGGQPETAVTRARSELQATLDNTGASAEEISAKLTALREARTKAQADLQAAQKDLKEVLTQRQEAVLVMMGTLE